MKALSFYSFSLFLLLLSNIYCIPTVLCACPRLETLKIYGRLYIIKISAEIFCPWEEGGDNMRNYLSLREAAERRGVSERGVKEHCLGGRIPGAEDFANAWAIPGAAKNLPTRVRIGGGKSDR